MVSVTNGRERTLEEYENLINQSGLKITRFIPTRASVSIIEVTL